jgi:hypothetical protein
MRRLWAFSPRSRGRRRALGALAALFALALAALLPASSSAAIVLRTLSGEDPLGAFAPDVAVDAQGDATATWAYHCLDVFFQGPIECEVQARSFSAAGTLSPVASLSAARSGGSQQVVVDDQGRALVAWAGFSVPGRPGGLLARARSSAGSWSGDELVSASHSEPRLAMDGEGDAVVVWNESFSLNDQRVQARARAADGTLAAVQTISASGLNVESPQVAVDEDGDALIAWEVRDTNPHLQMRTRAADGTLSAIQALSAAGEIAWAPQLAMSADGRALAVWLSGDIRAPNSIRARFRSAAGAWSGVVTLSAAAEWGQWPQVAMDDEGRALVVWPAPDGGGSRLRARARSAAGTWSVPEWVSLPAARDLTYANEPQVAMDASGRAFVVWAQELPGGFNIPLQIRARWPGGKWSAIRNLSSTREATALAQVDVSPGGRVVVVWEVLGELFVPGELLVRGATLAAVDLPPDTTPPQTTITAGPAARTSRRSPTFRFRSSQAGSSFHCRLDAGAWRGCASPRAYRSLAFGYHVFRVRAIDPSGNVDPSPALLAFRVVPETRITGGPRGRTTNRNPTFRFRASGAGCTFRCRLDAGTWRRCSSPRTYRGLALGRHVFRVRAIHPRASDLTPAVRTFKLVRS